VLGGVKPETRDQRPETRSQRPETRDQRPETRSQKPETRDQKPETRKEEEKKSLVNGQWSLVIGEEEEERSTGVPARVFLQIFSSASLGALGGLAVQIFRRKRRLSNREGRQGTRREEKIFDFGLKKKNWVLSCS
jgi:hypothetical protein